MKFHIVDEDGYVLSSSPLTAMGCFRAVAMAADSMSRWEEAAEAMGADRDTNLDQMSVTIVSDGHTMTYWFVNAADTEAVDPRNE